MQTFANIKKILYLRRKYVIMCTVHSVADYIITRIKCEGQSFLSNLKLQKLLYYTQAWHLGIHKQSLFDGEFQAWIHGPVNRELYDRFAGDKDLYSEIELKDRIETNPSLTQSEKQFVDFILENYAKFSATQLERMTHNELPWKQARVGFGEYERCEKKISQDLMKSFYGERWKKINA